jgi:Predicted periplasmic lipoprotein (DUF2279)
MAYTLPRCSATLLCAVAARAALAQDWGSPDIAAADAQSPPIAQATEAQRQQVQPQGGDGPNRFRTTALILAAVGGTAAYGKAKWWQDGFSGGFKTVNEGWFGRNTDYGGADKLGHAMSTYVGVRLLTRGFEWAGNDTERARKLGLWTSVGTMLGVELVDGYSKKWRFSKEDALVNLAGGALGYLLEARPELDDLIDIRLQYSRSTGPLGRRDFDPFGDYSGQRYLLVLKASGVPAFKTHPLMRYLELSVGYGTRNFEKESRAFTTPTRHAYYGVSLNLSELLRSTVYKGNASPTRTQRLTETFFEFVQVPAASAQGDHLIR